jgi:hypothetical protein
MQQLPSEMERNLVEQRLTRYIDEQVDLLDGRVSFLENPATATTTYTAPPNYLPNSHPEYSTLAYGTAATTPGTAGDTNYAAYNWFYETAAATDLSASAALIASGHSSFAGLNADAPVWDRVNGTFLLGSSTTNYDICCPLPTDFVFPGQKFYVYFEASLAASDTNINGAEFYCGFWDNTAGQRKWIAGSFSPTATVYGVAGARTLEYKIHARTDSGTEMLSSAITVTTANATLSTSNHVRLSFSGAPGFIEYIIYRKNGANYYRVGTIRNSIDLQFFDMVESGSTVVPVTGYPTVSGTTPQAYTLTNGFDPGDTGTYTSHTMTMIVPSSYNRSNTGNLQQYFRFGLDSLVASSGDRREVAIRRISVSEGYGGWTRSPRDLTAASGPSVAATSAPAPGAPPTTTPPPGGGGGPRCLVLNTVVDIPGGKIPIGDLQEGDHTYLGGLASRVNRIRDGVVQFVWIIETEDGRTNECSDDHRWPTGYEKKSWKPTRRLKVGDTLINQEFDLVKIVSKEKRYPTPEELSQHGGIPVRRIWIDTPNRFMANGIVTLNLKLPDIEVPTDNF